MRATPVETTNRTLADEDFLAIAHQALAQGEAQALRRILAEADAHRALWSADSGQMLIVELLDLLLDALVNGDAASAVDTIAACAPGFARTAHDLLLLAFFPDGHVGCFTELDDAALLCLALLTHGIGHRTRAGELLDQLTERPLDTAMAYVAGIARNHFVAAKRTQFKARLVIWGLDNALFSNASRSVNRKHGDYIRSLNRHGIVSAICARGDAVKARAELEAEGLWDEIVFPRIADQPAGEAVRQLIEDMLLQPANVLFIEHDARARDEAVAAAPGLHVLDLASPDCEAMLDRLVTSSAQVTSSRLADYRILEARVADRAAAQSDSDFLMQSQLQATCTTRMDNLAFVERIEELINRADPLNYTKTRVVPGTLRDIVMNVTDYDVFSAFIWDRYGNHGLDGLVGTVVYHRPSRRPLHLAFSCRIMGLGVEDFLLHALSQRYGAIDLSALVKPLPNQSSAAITSVPFEAVREQILATQAPRDLARIRLRVMSDCMSGAFHHYSRFKDEIDFDNIPRVFKLSSMITGAFDNAAFPEFLAYNTAIDYMDWRWEGVMERIDPAVYARAVEGLCTLVVEGSRKLLLFLPPENAPESLHAVLPNLTGAQLKARDRAFNALWREAARRHARNITVIELDDFITTADMLGHAYHYTPSSLKHMTGILDDWYARGGRVQ